MNTAIMLNLVLPSLWEKEMGGIMLNLVLPSLWEKEMGKLLHIGVSNKYRSAYTQGISQDKGKCYKKWDASSSKVKTYYPEGVHPVKKGTCTSLVTETAPCTQL